MTADEPERASQAEFCALAGELGISCEGETEYVDGRWHLCSAHIDALSCKENGHDDAD